MHFRIPAKMQPALTKIFRDLTDPPTPNLRGDRDIEYAWVLSHLPLGSGRALDFGCGNGYLGLGAALRGFQTFALDVRSPQWFYRHEKLQHLQTDFRQSSFAPESFDLIINCSAIEHVGLGRYGDGAEPDGDLSVMSMLREVLRPHTGVMLLTIPVGQDAIIAPWHRVYGPTRLPRLLEGYQEVSCGYWAKDRQNIWNQVARPEALATRPNATYYGLGCFELRAASGTVSAR